MEPRTVACPTAESLCRWVHRNLCDALGWEPSQAELRWELLYRRGQPCGVLFRLHGRIPTASCAIWAAAEHRLLFYDLHGHRWQTHLLTASPPLTAFAPAPTATTRTTQAPAATPMATPTATAAPATAPPHRQAA